MNAGELRLESASFSHDGGRDYNEDAVGDSDAFGAVRLFMLADGAGGQGADIERALEGELVIEQCLLVGRQIGAHDGRAGAAPAPTPDAAAADNDPMKAMEEAMKKK